MSDTTAPRTRKPADAPAPTLTPAAEAEPKPAKPAKPRAPIDPETQAMRRIESVLLGLQESDPTAPTRVLEYLLARRKSRALFPKAETYEHAGP